MLTFDDVIESDHGNMLNSKVFGVSCYNPRTDKTFDVIKMDAFILIDEQGLPIIEDQPMFNTSIANDIKQRDNLTINAITYNVREVRKDGIGGIDVYLKD